MIIIRNSLLGHSPMHPLVSFLSAAAAFFLAASGGLALAQEQTFRLTIKNHQFEPAEFEIPARSEEHTSELQSHSDLVCRLLLEKKKKDKGERGDEAVCARWRRRVHSDTRPGGPGVQVA